MRLARLAAPPVWAERHAAEARQSLRRSRTLFELIRELLLREGIAPESTCLMRRFREAEAALAAIPDPPELERADQEYGARGDTGWIDEDWRTRPGYRPPPVAAKTFESEVERLVRRYRAEPRIDFATASPMALLAWCLSRQDHSAAAGSEAAAGALLSIDAPPNEPAPGNHEPGPSTNKINELGIDLAMPAQGRYNPRVKFCC